MTRTEAKSLRVLLADDDEINAVVLQSVIRRLGHDADWVDSGSLALKALEQGGYDLVLMDLLMPGMTGMEATRRIREAGLGLTLPPIVAMSALGDKESLRACHEAGMDGYLRKPVDSRDLESVLNRIALPGNGN